MSVKQMGIVWDLDLPANQKFVLLAYADHADHDGNNVYPSLGRIAHKTGYSRDQVRRISRELVAAGLMELVSKATPTTTARYRLTFDEGGSKLPPLTPRGVGANGPPPVGAPMPPEPSLEPSVPPTEAKQVLQSGEEWPGDDASVKDKQRYFIAYLHRRLEERELLDAKPMTGSFRKQLAGELATHLNKGYRRARLLEGLDYIVHRWPEERVGLTIGLDRSGAQGSVRHLKAVPESPRRKKRVI